MAYSRDEYLAEKESGAFSNEDPCAMCGEWTANAVFDNGKYYCETPCNAAKAVLADTDLQIIGDIAEGIGSTEDHPVTVECFYIGWPDDLSAGIWGGSVSDTFYSVRDACEWVIENEEWLYDQFDFGES